MRPITCTACYQRFQSWQAWLAHRAVNSDMRAHNEHSRVCMSFEQWLDLAMAEMQQRRERVAQLV